jgi:colanic acid/amylovoran biosynthesis glycosyltransferase
MLEAMATGLAVVATLHGGIPEAITDNVSGLLTEERDGDRLLDNLFRLAEEDGLWPRLSHAAAQSVRAQFEQKEQIRRLETIYDEARSLGQAQTSHPSR